jgi:CPA2 family monovalent cation:H+ antiporter-2
VPRLLAYVGKFKSNEMLLVATLGLCFGVSLLAVRLGYSVALGAFVIGAVIAESREIVKIEHLMEPVRDMFSAVFFVAVGLMIQPAMLFKYWLPILVITLAVVVGKVLTCSFGAFIAGNDQRTSLRVGMGLAQIGEFSFIIAGLGLSLKVTSDFLYPIAVTVSVITTLLTPYLIKSSDAVVNWFDRVAPRNIAVSLDVYTRWVGELGEGPSRSTTGRFIRKWAWQIVLNMVLTAGVFIAALFVRKQNPNWMGRLSIPQEWLDALLWATALLLSMPLLIASYRKLQAMGMLVGEAAAQKVEGIRGRSAVKGVVSTSVLVAGTMVLGIVLLVLSAAILPSWKILIALLAIVAVITALMWRLFVRIYSRAQISLRETLDQPTVLLRKPESPLAGLLEKGQLASVLITPESRAHRRLIRELQLRTQTGASIVGFERAGTTTVNPDPEEELLAGDKVLLLGQPGQLEKARRALTEVNSAKEGE